MAQLRAKNNALALLVIYALVLLLFTFRIAIASWETLNVVNFEAKPNGQADSTNAFLTTWDRACSSTTPSTIYVPQGRFLLGNIVFKGHYKNNGITIRIDAALVPSNYNDIGNARHWLLFDDVNGVSIIGGVLDGQVIGLWACKRSGKSYLTSATVCLSFF